MSLKGFSASYLAIEPVDVEQSENIDTTSHEFVTPFPGSLKSIQIHANNLRDKDINDGGKANEAAHNQRKTFNTVRQNNKRRKQRKRD